MLQPFDTVINRPFKQWLEETTDDYVDCVEAEKGENYKWSVSDKRIMVTYIITKAMERLKTKEGIEMVKKAFLNCGVSIRPDGTEGFLIKIKDIKEEEIDFTGWEDAPEIVVKGEEPVDILCDDEQLVEAVNDELLRITSYHEEVIMKLKDRLNKARVESLRQKSQTYRTTSLT